MAKSFRPFYFLVLSVIGIGCLGEFGIEESRVDFGSRYSVLTDVASPSITNDSLSVRVGYSGCSGQHGFSLQFRFSGSSNVELWLRKDTPDQMCEAYWNELRRLDLPPYVRAAPSIVLLGPSGGQFKLR